METLCDFVLGPSDPEVSELLKAAEDRLPSLDRRFTQQEDLYIELEQPFQVGPFAIHHDVDDTRPSTRYLQVLRSVVQNWVSQIPGAFRGLSWCFDPKDLFHPRFVQVLTARDKRYLYVLRADLTFRGRHAELVERGTNTMTPQYTTRSLFLESDILPLEDLVTVARHREVRLHKLFPFTWQGETGRGYFVTGRWLDQEITRLLSRAALPEGRKIFPCHPLRCRFETLASLCLEFSLEGRKRSAAALEAAWPLVASWADRIRDGLKAEPYRENHPLIAQLRADWAGRLQDRWGSFRLEPYLTDTEQKEYRYYGD